MIPLNKDSSVSFGELAYVRSAVNHDDFLLSPLHNFMFGLRNESFMLPDKSPNFYIYDKEKHILIASFTEFNRNGNASIKFSLWHPETKFRKEVIVFDVIFDAKKAKADKSQMKLVSAKIKTALFKLSKLFSDSEKLFKAFSDLRYKI